MASSSIINIPSHHRAVVSIGGDKEPVIQLMPTPTFDPASDLILIRVRASSLNPVDYKEWIYNFKNQSIPFELGWDFSGEIIAVGKNAVGGWKVGDEVFSVQHFGYRGTHCDYCLVDGSRLARKPSTITHIQAASLPIAFTTAYDGIVQLAELSAKKTILISGASGGVGHLAVQLAKVLYGATVIALASRAEGIALLKSLQVDYVIDYKKDDVRKQVFEITGGKGVDVVFDATAGMSYVLTASLVREGGKFIGLEFSLPPRDAPFYKILAERKVSDTDISFADIVAASSADGSEYLRMRKFAAPLFLAADLLANGKIKIHIAEIIEIKDAPKEIVAMKNGKTQLGKVAVKHD